MAVYESKATPFLGFYVNGQRRKFIEGRYETTVKAEKDVLDGLKGVTCVEDDKPTSSSKPKQSASKQSEDKSKGSGDASDT